MRCTYVLEGDPARYIRTASMYNLRDYYETQREVKLRTNITLASQHGDRPLFSGPAALTIRFFIAVPPKNRKEKRSLFDIPHCVEPSLVSLLSFFQSVGREALFNNMCVFSKISMEKLYGEPRTEITIESI